MKCDKVLELISLFIDGQLNEKQEIEVKEHIEKCENCKIEYESLLEIIKSCNDLEQIDLPKDFHSGLRDRLEKEAAELKRNNNRFMNTIENTKWKKFAAIAAVLVVAVMSYSIGSMDLNFRMGSMSPGNDLARESAPYDDGDLGMAGMEEELGHDFTEGSVAPGQDTRTTGEKPAAQPEEVDKSRQDGDTWGHGFQAEADRKIIRTAYVNMETKNFHESISSIIARVRFEGGYVQNSEVYSRDAAGSRKYGYLELKIPKDRFGGYLDVLPKYGDVIEENIRGEDITSQYFDTESRIKMLRIQEDRLLAMLGRAENLNDMILLENELNRIRTEIERLTGNIRKWDNLIEYSTVIIEIREIKDEDRVSPIDNSLGERILRAFIRSLNNLISGFEAIIVFLSSIIPYLFIAALLIWLGKRFYVSIRK